MFFYGVDPLAQDATKVGTGRRLSTVVPPHFPRRQLDFFFDSESNIRMRDNVARMTVEPNGDFLYEVDVSGYKQSEIRVDVDANQIIVQAGHRESNGDETVERSLKRTIRVPDGLKRDQIKCEVDDRGHLKVVGTKVSTEQGRRRSIPVAYKPSPRSTPKTSIASTMTVGGGSGGGGMEPPPVQWDQQHQQIETVNEQQQ